MPETEIVVDPSTLHQEPAPFFAACYQDGQVATQGTPSHARGKKLPVSTAGQHDGVFAEWHWDGERLIVRNDRYGMAPLFYACHGDEIRLSPSLHQVLRGNVPRALDYSALAVLLRLGHCLGEDTPFAHIRALPPGSTLTWSRGQCTLTAPPLPLQRTINDSISFDEAVAEFARLFDRAIAKRLPEDDHVIVPLSGGRDSRHILLALHAHGHIPKACVTVKYCPPTRDEDARVARALARELGLTHVTLAKAPSWFRAVRQEVHLSNFCGGFHSWILPVAAYLQGRANTVYDGLAGDVLSAGFLNDERKTGLYRAGRLEELARLLLPEAGKEGFNRTVLTRDFYEQTAPERAVARLVEELKRHVEASNPMLSFIFWNRTRRMINHIPFAILAHVPTVHCPYLDHELFDFVVGLDPSLLLGKRLHDAAIRRTYPRVAHVPYAESMRKPPYQPADHAYFRAAVRELFRHALTRRPSWVRREYLYPRMLFDMVRPRLPLPWYLIGTVYCLELEAAWRAEYP